MPYGILHDYKMSYAVHEYNDNFAKRASTLSESTASNFSQESTEDNEDFLKNGSNTHSAMTATRIKYGEIVKKKIRTAKQNNLNKLDLSKLSICEIPQELLELENVQYLYLEGNTLESLPENFFDCLPNLKWLDLRRNYLQSIPHTYVGQHQNLQTLLLEGNELTSLPLELGLIGTLRGLNICDNPIEFPPAQIIEQGTAAVLKFMRELLQAKCSGTLVEVPVESEEVINPLEDSSENIPEDTRQKPRRSSLVSYCSTVSSADIESLYEEINTDLGALVLHSAPVKKQPKEKRKGNRSQISLKGNSATKMDISLRRKKKSKDVNRFPEPPPADRVEQRFLEERKLSKLRHLKMRQEDVLQKRKEAEFLKAWRSDTKQLQAEKYREAYMFGGAKDPVDVADQAPFGVDKGYMKVATNEERIKLDIQKKHEELRRPVSPETRLRIERERQARDQELERKIKTHIKKMLERRKQPRDNPKEALEVTKQDLEVAQKLQKEISNRRKNLEYRFTAFTGNNYL